MQTLPEAIAARMDGIHVVVAAGEGTRAFHGNMPAAPRLELVGVASRPTARTVFATDSFDDLPSITQPVLRAMCDGALRLIEWTVLAHNPQTQT